MTQALPPPDPGETPVLYQVVLDAIRDEYGEPGPQQMTSAQLSKFLKRALFPMDWARFMRMAGGGPPALMRLAETLAVKGQPAPKVRWLYACRDDQVDDNSTFTRLEDKHGEKARLLAKLESGRR